ncbi:unnamed protein product [Gulo gulo]|uniref:Uncharacterized protein n=1 Tax=Gulo gulo TaxID=48420 RepID=A0A9X9LN47_GULGU|nr:unnamed protein product [Gulo gulo]
MSELKQVCEVTMWGGAWMSRLKKEDLCGVKLTVWEYQLPHFLKPRHGPESC